MKQITQTENIKRGEMHSLVDMDKVLESVCPSATVQQHFTQHSVSAHKNQFCTVFRLLQSLRVKSAVLLITHFSCDGPALLPGFVL